MEFVAIGVSVIALAISLLSWRETRRQADAAVRDVELSERRHELEQIAAGSADLIVEAVLVGRDRSLVVRNRGLATARAVELDAEPPLGDRRDMPVFSDYPFPCDIAPGGEVSIGIWHGGGMADRLQVSVTWTDGGGSKEYQALLAIA